MSEENKPIFPRSPESREENTELIKETCQKLQKEELGFGVNLADGGQNVYCIRCGRENSAIGKVCGSCGFSLNNATTIPPPQLESFKPQFQTPVYGPPPMPFNELKKNNILWLVIGLLSGLLIMAVFIILILVFLRFR